MSRAPHLNRRAFLPAPPRPAARWRSASTSRSASGPARGAASRAGNHRLDRDRARRQRHHPGRQVGDGPGQLYGAADAGRRRTRMRLAQGPGRVRPRRTRTVRRNRAWGNMSTGASRSITASQQDLRRAGATAREMLIAAAAAAWNVPPAECTAANSVITHRPSGRTSTFGAVAAAAAAMPPPAQVPLKDPKDWKLIGTRQRSPRRHRQGHRASRSTPSTFACPACCTPPSCNARCSRARLRVGRRVAACRHERRPPRGAAAGRGRGRRRQLVAARKRRPTRCRSPGTSPAMRRRFQRRQFASSCMRA